MRVLSMENTQTIISRLKSNKIALIDISDADMARAICYGYEHLDAEFILSLISDDCGYVSQMVLTPLENKAQISDYLLPKFETVRQSGLVIKANPAKVVSGPVLNAIGNICCTLDQAGNEAVLLFKRNEMGMINQIDLCFLPNPSHTEPL